MAEQQTKPSGGDIENEPAPLIADEAARRLYRDFERVRAEIARLRKDVRRLSEEADDADSEDEELEEVEREILSLTARAALWIRRHPVRLVAGLIALAVMFSQGPRAWNYVQSYQATDDAQVSGHIDPVSSRIAGTVEHVYIEENQRVKAGTVLAEIDPRPYQIAVDRARADLAEAEAEIDATRQQMDSVTGMIAASEATVARTLKDVDRYRVLLKRKVTSDERYDQAVEAARIASSTTDSLRAQRASLKGALASRQASRLAAKAALEQALLNLGYTKIMAPASGIVGKHTVEVGERVQPGEELLAIVRTDDLWVTANFKETQLARFRPGMPATVHVDALGRDLRGVVQSMAGATGDEYSILPPENATGNFVKVVQRVPVHIRLDPAQPETALLRPGMSVEATVWLKR